MKTRVSIIVAMDEKQGIGKKNKIPWYVPGELARFKEITLGHPIIMGRKTHQSIGRVLPGRTNIVITRDPNYKALAGALVVHSLEEALAAAGKEKSEEIFIIGGGEIFSQAMPITNRLYLTQIAGDHAADVFFPDYSDFKKVVSSEEHEAGGYKYKFLVLEK